MEECITSEQILRSSNIKLWIFIVRVFSFLKIVFIVVYYYVVHLAARLACYDSASWIDGMSILNDQRFVFQLACVCNQAAYHMDGWLRLGEETGVHGENPPLSPVNRCFIHCPKIWTPDLCLLTAVEYFKLCTIRDPNLLLTFDLILNRGFCIMCGWLYWRQHYVAGLPPLPQSPRD